MGNYSIPKNYFLFRGPKLAEVLTNMQITKIVLEILKFA